MSSFNPIAGLRITLKVGATVFGLSAVLLALMPSLFLELLGLNTDTALQWSMRMIAITLIALTGNMLVVAQTAPAYGVRRAAIVMMIAATGLGAVTLAIPVELNLFTQGYAAIGFGFGAVYATMLGMDYRSR
jgi:uncharacterized membrane protein